jgi:hypothetical protein
MSSQKEYSSSFFGKIKTKEEMKMAIKKQEASFLPDTNFEGKDELFLDVDRMINEGLSGGSVHLHGNRANIEEAHPFVEEDPPNQ